MADYISREAASDLMAMALIDDWEPEYAQDRLSEIPTADVRPVVLCRDCKHRIVNKHYGEKGYMKLKAMCELDTGDPFELGRNAWDDDWFCADGEAGDD